VVEGPVVEGPVVEGKAKPAMAASHCVLIWAADMPWAAASASSVNSRAVQSVMSAGSSGGPLAGSRRTTAPDLRPIRSRPSRRSMS